MVNNSSASVREESPYLSAAIKRRAQSLIKDKSVDGPSRAIIRYGLETDDPWLSELVRRVDTGETIDDDTLAILAGHERSSEKKIERLTTLICRVTDEPATKSAALLVLMATIENSTHPKPLRTEQNISPSTAAASSIFTTRLTLRLLHSNVSCLQTIRSCRDLM